MWRTLRNLFVPSTDKKAPKSNTSTGPTDTTKSSSVRPSASQRRNDEIYSGYYSLILGVHSPADTELNSFESEARLRVEKLIKSKASRENLVPRLPAIIPKLMSSLRDDDTSGADLANLIGKDATLVAEVIRMANSPYNRTVNKIKNLEQAVLILGRTGIRHFLTKSAFKPILSIRHGYFTNLSSGWIWRQSEYCAFSAQCLAKKSRSIDPFEAYLAGLVRDVGMIVALQTMDSIESINDAPRSCKFQRIFSNQSLQLSALIAKAWEFPDNVIQAIDEQTKPSYSAAMSILGSVLHTATLMSQLQVLTEEDRMENKHALVTCRIDGRLTDDCKKCFSELQRYASKTD